MNRGITDIFIRRPILAICINLMVLLIGYQAILRLNVRQYPRSDSAVVTVTTAYIGAGAELVQGFVTTPLERVIASADGIDYLESSSAAGVSTITAHLRLNFDTNAALTQVQSKVAEVRGDLPPEAEAPIIKVETSDNRFAAVYLGFNAKDRNQNQITDYLTRAVQPRISAVPGVQKADILGARTFALRAWLDTQRMRAHGITASEVVQALRVNNALASVGATKGSLVALNLVTNTDRRTVQEFQNLVVRSGSVTSSGDGANRLVRLRDIAEVELGAENYDEDVRFDGQTATFMGIWVLPNANSLDVVKDIRALLPQIAADLPAGMSVGLPYDSTVYIRDSINEVIKTLVETILIVIVVIYLFIGSLRSVMVPVVAIPLSLVGGAGLMMFFGFTINLLTLLAIVLAVGLVVDDAIVMLENVHRHVDEGLSPTDAALKAAQELWMPIISMTITLAAVYAPIAFQGGLTGALFREFALTLAGAVVVSGFVALTLSPMMSARIVKANHNPGWIERHSQRLFEALKRRYQNLLSRFLSHYGAVVVAGAMIMALLLPFYFFSIKELAPREDQGVIFGILQAAPDATLDQTIGYSKHFHDIYQSFPEYDKSFQLTRAAFGFSGMVVKPWSERSRTTIELEGEAWGKASAVPGVRLIVTTPPPLPGGSDFPVEMVIQSLGSPGQLAEVAGQLVGRAFASGLFVFADTDLKFDQPEVEIRFDPDRVAASGLTLRSIADDLAALLAGNYVNRFSMVGRSYKVIPQSRRGDRLTPDQILDLPVVGPGGVPVSLRTFATAVPRVEPRSINRFQQLNSAKIQGAIRPDISVDQGLKVLESAAREILPPGYSVDYAGESRQLRQEGNALVGTLMLAIVAIFLVLAAQFESFRAPMVILLGSVPLALAGALLFVFYGFTSINVYTQVGLITLVGLISKNGILIVEFANHELSKGASALEAVKYAAETRFRPVLMTSVATVVGHFPLILASGAGSAARNSIGIVLVSGMAIGTVFTLFVVPALYVVIMGNKKDPGLVEV